MKYHHLCKLDLVYIDPMVSNIPTKLTKLFERWSEKWSVVNDHQLKRPRGKMFLVWKKAGGVVRTALPVSPKLVKLLEKLRNKLRIPNKTYQCDMEYAISRSFEQL